ncbi:chemotaxis protein CheA [Microbacteriaceae bacterium K1510]|nr:chemotaxis protein CheA [Microbacteriaceae bacterium K1510]
MTTLDQLKNTFFDECSEALQQIEGGLTDIRQGNGSDDTINAVFRSVHSVKGGAGIFGFDSLVGFAHVFETVLDAMRDGSLAPSPDIVDVLLPANDVLTDLISMSRAGEAIPANYGHESRAALERLLGKTEGDEPDGGDPAPADFEGLDFMPVMADQMDDMAGGPAGGKQTYRIAFRPQPEMLRRGSEPLSIIRELQKLGELSLTAETDKLPPLSEIVHDRPYLSWTGTLCTEASREQIDEIFEFVAECEVEIAVEQPAAPAPMPVVFTPPPAAETPVASLPVHQAPSVAPAAPTPAAEPAEASARAAPPKAAATTMRVEVEKIDRVVNMVGELVIAQAMLGQIVHNLPEDTSSRLTQILDEVIHHTRELKDSVMSMRAQAIGAVFQRMPRLVRELATKTGKKVQLEMHGENTEVDRSIIERLGDPLTHIIRNSIDHGIESPAARAAAGKSEEGIICLSAEHRGGRIVVEVRDDGGGIDPDRVLKKAREKGLVSPDAVLTEDEINNLIFMPGFSTAETISDISGRGVGMDVVRRNIQDVGGRITIKSERGRGMTLQLALPLTLAVMDGMVIKVSHETYVLPMSAIVECLRPSRNDIHNLVGGRGLLQLRGNLVPVVHLCDLLDMGADNSEPDERVVIIADAGDGTRLGIIVDELLGHQQVVVKSMEESYGAVPGVAGATILGNGRVALILDVEKLSELAVTQTYSFTGGRSRTSEPALAS